MGPQSGPIHLVRKRGLEPPRYCYRQPLKLVRLPIPPLPRGERSVAYFADGAWPAGAAGALVVAGAGAPGAAGAGVAGAGAAAGAAGGALLLRTDPVPRWPMIDSASAPIM